MAEKRLSAQEVLERRKMAKEAGTYNGASSSSESRNVQEVLERRNRAKEAGTYKAYEPKKVQSVAPSITNEQAKALTNQKTTGSAIRKYKEQQQDRYGTSDSRFEGLTNPTYQNYLDNIQIHATEQKHFGWLKEQASNLESMKRYPEIAEAVKAYHTARWNPLEYMQKYDAENVLKKYGYDEEGIKSLVDTYNRERNALASAAMKERADELTDSGLLGKAVAKLEGFGANMASIFAVPQEWANTLNEKITGEYNPLDTNSAFQALGEYRDRIEQNITEDIKGTGNGGATLREALNKDEEETPAHRQALGDVYQAASSVANNLATAAAFGQAGALAVMGAQAAQSSMNDTFKRTGDNTKSSLTGTAAGLIEAGTEYLPMDNLWDMIKGTGKTLTRSTLANWIVQSGIEGAEEMTSEALNTLVDRWINSQDSNYELNVRNYMNQGYDEEKARDLAFGDFTGQVWEAGKVGALAGGIGGGIAVGANKLAQYGTGADALETTGKMEQVVAQAENYEDTRVKKALKSYQEKPSSMNAGKLIYEMYAVDEIARNKAEKKDKGKLLRKNTKNRKEGQISQAQNALEETKSQNTEHKPQIDVENAVIRMSEAQNAEELSDVMHEVEDNGTEEQIQEARSYYEMRGAQMVVEGKTTNEELAFTGMQMSEAKAYEAGSKNEAVAPEKLSLKGKIAYNEGQQSYVKELARKNIISNTEDVIGAKVTDNAGKELVIQDIILEGREPSVRTSNGTANLKDISFQNEAVGLLYNNASTLGSTKAAQAYVKNYPGNIMVNGYHDIVQSILKDGELGLNIDKVLKRRAGATYWIKEEGVREFYALGKEKAKDSNRQLETVKRKGKGQLKDKRRGKTEEPLMKVLEQIAEHTGLDIEVSDKEVSDVRGYFEESLSRIVLNADANMFETVFHELGEFTDSWNTEGMQKFQTALLDWYFETHDNEKMQNLIESVQNVYKQQEGSKTYREAANEIVNDAISGLFATETGTKDFTEWLGKNRTETETKTILQTIADFLKDLCDAIRTYISEHNLSGTTRTAMEMSEERAKELRKQFLDAMDKAVENYQQAENRSRTEDKKRNSIKETSSEINSFGLVRYTEHEVNNFSNGRTFFAETKQDIEEFIKKYVHKKPYSRILCGKIDSKLAERIKIDTGIDISNYNVAITSEYENKHVDPAKEAKQGMVAMSPDIVALLPDIITNYDKVEYAGYNKQQQQVLRFEKNINGRKVAVEYVSKGRKTIDLQTMYGWENKKEKNSHQASHANAHDRTFKTNLDMSSSTDSISKTGENTTKRFSLVGVDENGIEVYETSEETKKLSYAERKAKLLDLMKHEYAGRTAKFVKGGKVYYAQYNTAGLNKGVHGDRKSDHKGYNAKINIGADGNYIELAENALYKGSSIEQGKNSKFHSDAKQWDYYVKTIQSDGVYFNVLINVKDAGKEQYVYDITLKEATHQRALKHLRLGEAASNSRIPQNQKNATKRFSLAVDSEGRTLSEAQQEFFKDSKVRDENGKLLVMYHGTENDFTVFNPFLQGGKNGIAQGYGIYFSDTPEVSEKFGGKLMKGYLRVVHPATFSNKTIQRGELLKLIKATSEAEAKQYVKDGDYDNINDALKDTWISNYADTYGMSMNQAYNEATTQILATSNNDMDIIQEVMVGNAVNDFEAAYKFYDILKSTLGIDGFITELVNGETNEKSQIVIAFESNQFKNTDNYNPTQNEDIRYSLDINQYLDENEQGLFWNKIGERKNGTQFPKSRNGDSILTIGNKLVYTGRGYQNPKVNKIVEVIVKEDSEYEDTYTSFIQEDIIDYERNKELKGISIEDFAQFEQQASSQTFGRKVSIKFYDGQDSRTNGKNGLDGKGQVRQRTYYNFEDEQNGNGDTREIRGSSSLRYSLNDATDLSDFWFNNDNLEEPIGNAASILEEGAKLLQGKEVDTTTIRRIARGMVKEYHSHYNVDTLSENLEKLFSYMQSQDKVSYDDMIRIMTEVTMPVIEESTSIDETQQEIYKTFKKNLRNMSIKLSTQQKEEVAHYYDSYENFRRKMFGTLNLSESGQELDSLWFEISQMSNGFIDWDVTEADQPIRLVEALEQMKPQVVNNFGADNHGVAMDMALRIYEEYFKAQHSAKVRSLENKMKQERKDLRQQYEDGLLKIKNSELQRKYNQEAAEYRFKIKKTANELIGWIEKPTNQKHVPKELKGMVLEFLDCIDFVSHRAKEDSKATIQWKAKMENISKRLFEERIEMEKENGGGPLRNFIETLNPDFIPTLDKFLDESGEAQKISQMDKEQLKRVAFLIRTMKTAVQKANELHANTMYRYAADAGTKTLRELETRKKRKGQTMLGHDIGKTLSLEMAEPKTYFERLGEGATSIYKEIRKGMDKRIFLIREARQYMEEVLKDVKPEELKTWTGKNATVHEVKTRDGNIKLTTGQVMSLYLLSKRAQGLRHILLGGIKPAQIGEGKKAIIQHDKARVTPEQLKEILELLTPERKAFADKLQKFLSENCADWGNEVTMQLYEYERFLEKGYFPIRTVEDQHGDKGKPNDKQSVYAIKNFGFTKSISKDAPQAIWIEDVLDVFTDHVTRMASYNAYLIPLSDAMKWFNFNESGFVGEDFESESVHGMIEKVYGQEANEYFKELLYEINGRTRKSKLKTVDMLIRNFKKGSVMAKFSVAIQQPTAYVRALNVLDAKDMLSALDSITSIKKLKENANEAIQYSAIAQWKDWGFFESHISKSMKQVITKQQTKWEKIEDYASWGAQTADKGTWGVLWYACKKEIARTRTELEVDSKEFFEAVAERFDEVIDETQVVDSILHKSPILKAADKYLNMEMAFQNENLKSYNTFYRAANHMAREEANGFKKIQKAFINKKFGRAVTVHLFSVLLNSMSAAFAYAFRDDKEEAFGQRYAKRLRDKVIEGVNPLSLFPLAKDIISLLQGYDVERVDMQAISDIINAGKNIYKRITKPDTSTYTWYALAKKTANGICTLTGAPFYNVWNDAESFFEELAGMNIPEQETNGDLYEDLIWSEKGSNVYERAYKKLQKQKGKTDKDIKKGIRSKLNTMFKEGELTEEEAKDALRRFGYKDVSDIVKKWKENMEK